LRGSNDLRHGRRRRFNWYNQEIADNLVAAQCWTRYDPLIAIPRLVDQFKHRDLKLTFFVRGWVIEKSPPQIDLIESGDEIGLHGYLHERSNEISREDKLYWFERGFAAYRHACGRPPRGWRAPSFALSKHRSNICWMQGSNTIPRL
jgi:peptidoglycan/xylan/chitin deacetylase (PgdA/CDA1 family)